MIRSFLRFLLEYAGKNVNVNILDLHRRTSWGRNGQKNEKYPFSGKRSARTPVNFSHVIRKRNLKKYSHLVNWDNINLSYLGLIVFSAAAVILRLILCKTTINMNLPKFITLTHEFLNQHSLSHQTSFNLERERLTKEINIYHVCCRKRVSPLKMF